MPTVQIKDRYLGKVLFECEGTLLEVVEKAVAEKADLSSANLSGAYLSGAILSGANLSGAYLGGANLRGAYLGGANLEKGKTRINWRDHYLISEILRRAAGDNVDRLMVAGLIQLQLDWCWEDFLAVNHAETDWAIGELSGWFVEGNEPPKEFMDRQRTNVSTIS